MSKQNLTARSQAGFTLVELAIVMIIIGLLIGGVLKGQELIGNAQTTATVAQVKAIEAATSTFKDTYAALPGDIISPDTRLPNCTVGACATDGNGNGRLDNLTSATPIAAEGERYFVHLNAANLMTGIIAGASGTLTNFPTAKISGNFIQAGNAVAPADLAGAVDSTGAQSGLYLTVINAVGVPSATTVGLKPNEGLRIDTKVDDGVPGTGIVRGIGGATCGSTGAAGEYNTALSAANCGLYIKIQG